MNESNRELQDLQGVKEDLDKLQTEHAERIEQARKDRETIIKYIFKIKNDYEGDDLIPDEHTFNLNLMYMTYNRFFREWVAAGNSPAFAKVLPLDECITEYGRECPQLEDIPLDNVPNCRGIAWSEDGDQSGDWVHFCAKHITIKRWRLSDAEDMPEDLEDMSFEDLRAEHSHLPIFKNAF